MKYSLSRTTTALPLSAGLITMLGLYASSLRAERSPRLKLLCLVSGTEHLHKSISLLQAKYYKGTHKGGTQSDRFLNF